MNNNLLILILLVIGLVIYYCLSSKELFSNVLTNNTIQKNNNNLTTPQVSIELPKTILDLKSQVNQIQSDEILWEKKSLKINDVISSLKNDFSNCGAENLNITSKDLNFSDSRIKFIKFLPVSNLLNKLTYENIKCFVQKFDKNNLISMINEEYVLPKYLLPYNIIVVNNSLYQMTPAGVMKYNLNIFSKYKGNNALNASIEVSLLNDYNFYNRSNNIIFPFKGALIQKVGSNYTDLKTGDTYEIKKLLDRVDLINLTVNKERNMKEMNMKDMTMKDISHNIKTKQAIEKEIYDNDEVKNTLIKISQSQNLPDIKSDVNKLLTKLVAIKAESCVINRAVQKFTNVYENFDVLGIINKVPVSGKDSLSISPYLPLQEIISNNKIPIDKNINMLGVINKVPVSGKDSLSISPYVVQEIISNNKIPIAENISVFNKIPRPENISIFNKIPIAENISNKIPNAENISNKITVGIANTVVQEILVDTPDKKNTRADIGKVNEKKLNEEVIYVFEYNGINYLFTKDEVKPYSKWAKDINILLSNYMTTIKTIIPHYFTDGENFKTRLMIILEDDFYVIVEDEKLQSPKDWTKDMEFAFSRSLHEVYNCNENRNILDQMVKVNIITNDKKKQILNKLKCQ